MKRTTQLILLGVLWCYKEEWIQLHKWFPGVNIEVSVKDKDEKKKMFQNYEKSTMDQLRKCKMKVLTWLSRSTNLNNNRKSPKGVLRLLGTQDFGRDGCKFLHKNQKTCCYKKKLPQTSFTEQVIQPCRMSKLLPQTFVLFCLHRSAESLC